MAAEITPESMLVIGRIGGSSSSRRQRRFATVDKGEAALTRWAREGFTVFWAEIGEGGLSAPFRMVDGKRVPLR